MKNDSNFNNYKYFVSGNKVIAVSTYAKKTVRGVAKCSSADTFDEEKGKKLAAARCNLKVSQKRYDRAMINWFKKYAACNVAQKEFSAACSYCEDSDNKLKEAERALKEIEASL